MPIRIVPEVVHVPDEKNEKALTVKFKVSPTDKTAYKVLVAGDIEAPLYNIRVHKTSMINCKMKEEVVAACSLIHANRLDDTTLTVAGPVANQPRDVPHLTKRCVLLL